MFRQDVPFGVDRHAYRSVLILLISRTFDKLTEMMSYLTEAEPRHSVTKGTFNH